MENILMEAKEEIYALRRRNEVLQAKVDTMNIFASALNATVNNPSQGYTEDICWKIEKEIQKLKVDTKE